MNSEQLIEWCQAKHQCVESKAYQNKPLIMGILNVTPDSFSDGGKYISLDQACLRAEQLIQDGADLIDIGGETSQPGAVPISIDEELARVIPVIERIRANSDIAISVDTYKAQVMKESVQAGASMINDIMALRSPDAMQVASTFEIPVCLMHMHGLPQTMQNNPIYSMDVVEEINQFFFERIDACERSGIKRERLIIDPGFGFGKSVKDNLSIIKRLGEIQCHRTPVLLGVSRKSTIGAVLQKPVGERLLGGIAIALHAALNNMAIIRTHDVDETYQALHMLDAIEHIEQR